MSFWVTIEDEEEAKSIYPFVAITKAKQLNPDDVDDAGLGYCILDKGETWEWFFADQGSLDTFINLVRKS